MRQEDLSLIAQIYNFVWYNGIAKIRQVWGIVSHIVLCNACVCLVVVVVVVVVIGGGGGGGVCVCVFICGAYMCGCMFAWMGVCIHTCV